MLCSDGLSGMVRFDDIREVLRTTPEPVDACKLLAERANQAGGHDNITVIVAQLRRRGPRAAVADAEPLKYRKYALPEEPADTEPNRRMLADVGARAASALGPGSGAPQGLGSTVLFSSQPPGGAGLARAGRGADSFGPAWRLRGGAHRHSRGRTSRRGSSS